MCSSRKYLYSHKRDCNFLGGGSFSKTIKFKEMYEAYNDWNFQRGRKVLEKNPFNKGGMDILWNHIKYAILMTFLPMMEWTDIEKVCQVELLCFTKRQSSQDFIFSGLFVMTKSWYHTPDERDSFNQN